MNRVGEILCRLRETVSDSTTTKTESETKKEQEQKK